MKKLLGCVFGPKLFRIHRSSEEAGSVFAGRPYVPNPLESRVDYCLNAISTTKNALYYTSPLWMVMLYRRDAFTFSFGAELLKYSVWFAVVYFGLLFARGLSRSGNPVYVDFLEMLEKSIENRGNPDDKRKYDFTFSHWPVDFNYIEEDDKNKEIPPYHFTGRLQKLLEKRSFARLIVNGLPCEIVSYIISHGFGLSMMYPGSTALMKTLLAPALAEGRNKLVEQMSGKRAKLVSKSGDSIDTMFVDARPRVLDDENVRSKAHTLVICCEGNAGFYEVGCMATPMETGHSVLGWNHPGFGGSTGTPSPAAEISAIDVVVQYAQIKLGFQEENIAIFAWSIGAFSAIHAARLYPNIKFLFLDATFADILPLAQKAMPQSFEGIVTNTVRSYINLNNAEALNHYHGPVHFMRREMDEVMNIDGQAAVSSNCGNPLLYAFLRQRFPLLFGKTDEEAFEIKAALDSWLGKDNDPLRASVLESFEVDEARCEKLLHKYTTSNSTDYPVMIGEGFSMEEKQRLVLYLAVKHMSFYESSHCPPLPSSMFGPPWDITKSLSDVTLSDSDRCSSEEFEIVNGNDK